MWTAGAIWVPLPGHLLAVPSLAGAAAGMVATCPQWRNRRGWRKKTCEAWAWVFALVAVVALLHAVASVG